MFNYYKLNRWMKGLTIIGGCFGLYYCINAILHMRFTYDNLFTLFTQIFRLDGFFRYVLGMFIASLTLLVAFKPNDPLPWHWLLLFIFSILLIFVCHFFVGLWVLVASGIGFLNYL